MSYQWQRQAAGSGVWNDVVEGAKYTGANMVAVTVSNLLLAESGDQYRCIVTNVAGTAVYIDNGTAASLGDIELTSVTPETTFAGATLKVIDHTGNAGANDFFVMNHRETRNACILR